jgi:hypothetical protein
MVNDLQGDPRIRERFQFWFFSYETGNPVAYSAMRLREALEAAVAKLDPSGRDLALQRMVLVGHSQGGLLTKLMVVEMGTKEWGAAIGVPFDDLQVPAETKELLRRMVNVRPLPFVRRVVFLATPHQGSYVSGNWLVHQVGRLVRLPGHLSGATSEAFAMDPRLAAAFRGRVGSVYAMTPGSPLVRALAPLSLAPGIGGHSIIAVAGDGPIEEGSDGVVEYASAHLDGMDSELVIRSGHSVQQEPEAIEEVRRILLLHVAEACAAGMGCPDAAGGTASRQ